MKPTWVLYNKTLAEKIVAISDKMGYQCSFKEVYSSEHERLVFTIFSGETSENLNNDSACWVGGIIDSYLFDKNLTSDEVIVSSGRCWEGEG